MAIDKNKFEEGAKEIFEKEVVPQIQKATEKETLEESVFPKNNIIESWLEEHGDPEICKQVELKLEKITLEKSAENYANKKGDIPTTELEDAIFKQGFIAGAKWQMERSYSEEEVLKLLEEYGHDLTLSDNLFEGTPKQWFEQFKKK